MMTVSKIELLIKIIGICIAIFGVWTYFYEQSISQEKELSKKSIEYIEKFEENDLREARSEMLGFWKQNEQNIALIRASSGISQKEYNNFIKLSFTQYERKDYLIAALIQFDNFIGQINFCIKYELCNKILINEYFCVKMKLFANTYGPFYEVMNHLYDFSDSGEALTKHVRHCYGTS